MPDLNTQPNDKSQTAIENRLARMGLQNSEDVLEFLNTPEGEEIEGEILKELAIQAQLEQQQVLEEQELEKRHDLLLMLMILGLLDEENANAETLVERIEADIKHLLQSEKTQATRHSLIATPEPSFNQDLSVLLQQKLNDKTKEAHLLNEQQTTLDTDKIAVEEKYAAYQQGIDALFQHDSLNTVEKIEDKIAQLEMDAKEEVKSINKTLSEQLNSKDKSGDVETRLNPHKLFAKQLEINGLKEQKSILVGDSTYYHNKTTGNPQFIVPKHQKLIEENGHFYLLRSDEVLDDTNRETAKNAFRISEPGLTSVYYIVHRNQHIERSQLANQQQLIDLKNDLLQKEMTILNTQLQLQPKLNFKPQLKNQTNDKPNILKNESRLTPSLNPSASKTLQPVTVNFVKSITELLLLIANRGPNKAVLDSLKRQLARTGLSDRLHLDSLLTKLEVGKKPSFAVITDLIQKINSAPTSPLSYAKSNKPISSKAIEPEEPAPSRNWPPKPGFR